MSANTDLSAPLCTSRLDIRAPADALFRSQCLFEALDMPYCFETSPEFFNNAATHILRFDFRPQDLAAASRE